MKLKIYTAIAKYPFIQVVNENRKAKQQQQKYPMQTHTIMRLWNDITLSDKEYQL